MKNFDQKICDYVLENYGIKSSRQISTDCNIKIGEVYKYQRILLKLGKINKLRNYNPFSNEETQYIIDNVLILNTREIADSLKRNVGAISRKKVLLLKAGLIKENKRMKEPLKDGEEGFIRENIWELGAARCAKILNRSPRFVGQRASQWGLETRPDILFDRYDISHFTDLKDPFVIYFLGFFWADGWLSDFSIRRIKFKINNIDFHDAITPNIGRLGNFWNYREYDPPSDKPHWKKSSVFEVSNLYLWQFLDQYDYQIKTGASACKILTAIPENLRHYWWRGYFDGDGNISDGRACFHACYEQDWKFLLDLGKILDIDFEIDREDRGDRKGSKGSISNYPYVKRLHNYMYQGEQFGLKRKLDRFVDYLTNIRQKSSGDTSQYWGVSKGAKANRWTMQITHNEKYVSKRFANEIDAAREYDKLAKEFFGNRALLNFPNE